MFTSFLHRNFQSQVETYSTTSLFYTPNQHLPPVDPSWADAVTDRKGGRERESDRADGGEGAEDVSCKNRLVEKVKSPQRAGDSYKEQSETPMHPFTRSADYPV
ncbi:hypothetical protein GN956_G18882 [Arapaima gigas]